MNKTVRNLLMTLSLVCGLQGLAWAAAGTAPLAGPASAPATVSVDNCNWNKPGVNPFMGDVVAAVDRYRDIPVDVRERLKARMAKREYDDLVSIRRDSINGRGGYDYGNTISEMHFGTHQVCRSVTRTAWTPTMEERGLVYCESGHCILVPTVCRNVSRIARKGVGSDSAQGLPLLGAPPLADSDSVVALGDVPPIDWFGPTGAGVPEATGAGPLQSGGGGFYPAGGSSFANGFNNGGGDYGGIGGIGGGTGGSGVAPAPTVSTSATPPPGTDVPVVPPVTVVPEPQTWALMLGGLAALLVARRRRGVR